MKKIILLAVFAIALTMTGCNGCTMMAKNIESNYSELHRDVVVLNAFTGDTLFASSIGRTDLFSGDEMQMIASLRRIVRLPADLTFYPGHGPSSTIGLQLKVNPYLQNI